MNSIAVRMVIYVLSPLFAGLVALVPGWGISFDGAVLTVQLETLVAACVAALGVSGAVFARWGVS